MAQILIARLLTLIALFFDNELVGLAAAGTLANLGMPLAHLMIVRVVHGTDLLLRLIRREL